MNAKTCPPDRVESILSDPSYIAEYKIDGYRCIFENGSFHSRLGNTFELPQIAKYLQEYNVCLDGELYIPGGCSSDITTALGSKGDKSKLRYVVFDMLRDNDDLLWQCWESRRRHLENFYYYTGNFVYNGSPIDISRVFDDKLGLTTFDKAMDFIESYGIEGLMLKRTNATYVPDKRPTNNWWKLKKHMTYDVVVMGYEDGKGKYKGLIGSIVFGLYKDGTLTECGKCSGITDELRREITENQQGYIGRVMEIKAMERTKDGHFRHPVFGQWRSDKLPKQCLWEQ